MERVIENNKLIAEFMGLTTPNKYDGGKTFAINPRTIDGEIWAESWFHPDYHTNWNSLMPVLDKIDSLGYFVHIKSTLNRSYCLIYCDASREEFAEVYIEEPNRKLQTIYETVVEFIERYNELLSTDKAKTV